MGMVTSTLGYNGDEDPLEVQGRKDADFLKYEAMVFKELTEAGVSSVSTTAAVKIPSVIADGLLGFLGDRNPLARNAQKDHNTVWILDNTAYKTSVDAPWNAEFVACFFQRGRGDITKAAASIADMIGLHGDAGDTQQSRKLIEERLKPFVDAVAPIRCLPVVLDSASKTASSRSLGPSNLSGISVQTFELGDSKQRDGSNIDTKTDPAVTGLPQAQGVTRFYGPEGFGVISDIDDTIKITMTTEPTGILKTTFSEPGQFTSHMPDFYKMVNEELQNPGWFYVSASPYNLYPFLRSFIHQYYPPGQIFLRDASWQTLGGLLSVLTTGVKQYKTTRIETIHSWFPKRRFICFGDSTQMDPETYAAAFKNHPGWILAIYIRKVLNVQHMEHKNSEERFRNAFEGIPETVWKVFVLPDEVKDHFSHVMSEADVSVTGKWSEFSCGDKRQKQQLEQDQVGF